MTIRWWSPRALVVEKPNIPYAAYNQHVLATRLTSRHLFVGLQDQGPVATIPWLSGAPTLVHAWRVTIRSHTNATRTALTYSAVGTTPNIAEIFYVVDADASEGKRSFEDFSGGLAKTHRMMVRYQECLDAHRMLEFVDSLPILGETLWQ